MKFNEKQFYQIYQEHKVLVYNVALNYLQNIEEAEEITQDVFVKVHQNFEKFQEKSSLKTWIYKIAINKCLDFIKHKNSQKRFFIFGKKAHSDFEITSISTFEHPGIILENKENAAMLFKAINELPENQKTAFILSKIDGLTNSEVAEIMEVTVSSVESLLFRAKKNLREQLENFFEQYHKKK